MGLLLLEVVILESFSPGAMKVNFFMVSDKAEVESVGVSTETTLTLRKCVESREGRCDKDVGEALNTLCLLPSPQVLSEPLREECIVCW